jgi:hypothetical protein
MAEKQTAKNIQVVGPKDSNSLAGIYRFPRDGRKKAIDIVKGQILTVGKNGDITESEAQRLLNNQTWEVKEVSE